MVRRKTVPRESYDQVFRQLLALQSAGEAITSSLDLQLVLDTVTREMARFLGVSACALSKWNLEQDTLHLLLEFGPDDWWEGSVERDIYYLRDFPLTKQVLESKEAVQITISQADLDPAEATFMKEEDITTLVMLPMIFQDKVIGLVELMDGKVEKTFTLQEMATAQFLANQAAIAIHNARLFEEVNRRLQAQLTIREAMAIISSTLDLTSVLNLIAEQLGQAVDATSAYISTYNTESKSSVVVVEYYGPEAHQLEKASDLGEQYQEEGHAYLETGTAKYFHHDDPQLSESEREHLEKYGAQTVLVLPMQIRGETIAFAELWESRWKREFTQDEIVLCNDLAKQAAIAIENARLYDQAQKEIEERKKVADALKISEERFALAIQGARDGIWDWNLRTGTIFLSPRWWTMIGENGGDPETYPEEWLQRVHPSDRSKLEKDLEAHIQGMTNHFENEHRIRHSDGTYRWMLARGLAVRGRNGKAYRLAGSLSDITARKQAEQQLIYDAFHDSLTGLPNRSLFLDRLDRAIERTKRRGEDDFAILFLDLDRFKVINDSLGHEIGDKLLIAVARRLEVSLRSVDTVARLGGDEFVILLEDIHDIETAALVAERILRDLKNPFEFEGHQIFSSASIGIVLSSNGYDRPEDALRDADIALYHAKSRGRARHEVFDKDMRLEARARLTIENDLRRAIGNQEFSIHYQPIVSLRSGELIGFEALVRWPHPELGYILPADFIPVAEETSLIIPIDWWVLREACQQLKIWQERFPRDPALTISVNLSSKHFSQFDLVQQVENILRVTELNPESLILEITENAIIENQASATKLISNLRAMGIQVQIDDFGTGYSSLSYIQKYPIDAIKIDRSFIAKIGGKGTDIEIVRTILRLAKELGVEAIAEGVETPEQLEQLRSMDCELAQGYFFARPQEPGLAEAIFDQSQTWMSPPEELTMPLE